MKKNIFKYIALTLCSTLLLTTFACSKKQGESGQEGKPIVTVVEGEYLYLGGVSEYSILIRDDANFYESFAATELADNLKKATGNNIPIVTESELKNPNRVISLGHTTLWDENVDIELSANDIVDSGYYIKTVDTNVYISCPDLSA